MRNKPELLVAFDQFLDQSTVIPPGTWDTTIRLKPPAKTPSKVLDKLFFKLLILVYFLFVYSLERLKESTIKRRRKSK